MNNVKVNALDVALNNVTALGTGKDWSLSGSSSSKQWCGRSCDLLHLHRPNLGGRHVFNILV